MKNEIETKAFKYILICNDMVYKRAADIKKTEKRGTAIE